MLEFGKEEGKKIRMLGSYIGWEDISQRLRRSGLSWFKIRNQLRGSRLSKKTQARIVETCVESTLLFDCQARTWRKGEMKKLQKAMDKRYRLIWSRRNQAPLRQMQTEGKNMQDVRNELGIKSIRYKIEKRTLERIGHVFRMPDDRVVKASVLGWLHDLENWPKVPGQKRKTILYWKGLLREAGVDQTKIGSLTADKDGWKSIVRKRMKHIEEWEKKGGKQTINQRGERIQPGEEDDLICRVDGCGKTHKSYQDEVSTHKKIFKCEDCQEEFKQEATLINHKKACTGLRANGPEKRACHKCGRKIMKKGFSKHRRQCDPEAAAREEAPARVYRAKRKVCENCGVEGSASNYSKHLRKCRGDDDDPAVL